MTIGIWDVTIGKKLGLQLSAFQPAGKACQCQGSASYFSSSDVPLVAQTAIST
jgi:hypothetical protein